MWRGASAAATPPHITPQSPLRVTLFVFLFSPHIEPARKRGGTLATRRLRALAPQHAGSLAACVAGCGLSAALNSAEAAATSGAPRAASGQGSEWERRQRQAATGAATG